jgi:hypothetical protein
MKIIEVKDGSPIKGETEPMTEEQLQREYDFYIAESIIGMLYKEGKITEDERHKISALNPGFPAIHNDTTLQNASNHLKYWII